MSTPNGFILYRGPSMIDGSPIVAIATGLQGKASRNGKTGELVQTWIIRDDMSPTEAVAIGADSAICGACPHMGQIVDGRNVNRSCYVTVFQAPLSVYKAYKRGIYAEPINEDVAAEMLRGKRVRLGAYGDPSAVPFAVWDSILRFTEARTGYTHQWRNRPVALARYVMASCDNDADYVDAKAMGYRTFRVRTVSEPIHKREIACPASKEMGVKTNCAACVACGGNSAKARVDVTIIAHGAASKVNAFNAARTTV